MQRIYFLFLCIFAMNCFSQDTAKYDYKTTDKQLNMVYNKILLESKSDTLFVKRLKEAQRAWIKFRDAQIEARFPTVKKDDQDKEYGSIYPVCACLELTELTKQRINQLEAWLNGTVEGNVCGGSYKTK